MTQTYARGEFAEKLAHRVKHRGNPVVVGLDPRWENLPTSLKTTDDEPSPAVRAEAFTKFCQEVIDVVADMVPAVKPQAAFFEQLGPSGMYALADVVQYARSRGLLVVLDGKRNDIGSTASAYADAYLGESSVWQSDALTVSPYLGDDSLTPFVDVAARRGAGIFVLVKTSNPGGGQFQDLTASGHTIFQHVAHHVEALANKTKGASGYGIVGAVVGATYPAQLAELRGQMPSAWILVPGYGSQGATARDVAGAFDEHGLGAIVNSSRGIIFAHENRRYAGRFAPAVWQDAVRLAAQDMIDELRAETTAGNLG